VTDGIRSGHIWNVCPKICIIVQSCLYVVEIYVLFAVRFTNKISLQLQVLSFFKTRLLNWHVIIQKWFVLHFEHGCLRPTALI